MKEYKVYQFYLKSNKDFYAFTIDKNLKNKFLYQRNKDLFHVEKVHMNEYEFMVYQSKNNQYMLTEIPLNYDEKNYYMLVATYAEENILQYRSDQIDEEIGKIYRRLVMQTNLKKKYIDSIEYLSKVSYINEMHDNISTANLFALFMKEFKFTFKENKIDEDD